MTERFTNHPEKSRETSKPAPIKEQTHEIINLHLERKKHPLPQMIDASPQSYKIIPLPKVEPASQNTQTTVFDGRRKFFQNLNRENDENMTQMEKNARHPVLTKHQVTQIYKAMENGSGIETLQTSEFLQDTKKAKERQYLQELLYTQETPKDLLIASNQKLVMKIATQYEGRGFSREELYIMGNLGLLHAIKKFNPDLGNAFSTYATWWIRQSMLREMADTGRLISVPVHTHEALGKAMKLQNAEAKRMGRKPTYDEFQKLLSEQDFSSSQVEFILPELYEHRYTPQSLDKHVLTTKSEEGCTLGAFIEDKNANTEAEALENFGQEELRSAIEETFSKHLTPREAAVLKIRFGIGADSDATLGEVGEELGLSRERVRQIEANALKKLRRIKFLNAFSGNNKNSTSSSESDLSKRKQREEPEKQTRVEIPRSEVKRTTMYDVINNVRKVPEIWKTLSLKDQQILQVLGKHGEQEKDIMMVRLSNVYRISQQDMENYISKLIVNLNSTLNIQNNR